MLKFKFNYLENILAYQTENTKKSPWYEIVEQFEGNFGSQGFQLMDGWITFSVYHSKIRVFYKQIKFNNSNYLTAFGEEEEISYFRKDLPKQVPVIFEFTPADEVEKIGLAWIKKGGTHE